MVIIDRPSVDAVSLPDGVDRIVVDLGEAPSAAASAQGRRRLGDMLAMGRAVARARLDLMYFPATYTFFPVWNVPRLVVTMHDTLALAHPELVFPTRRGRLAWLLKEHAAARLADRIVTVSETSRRDLRGLVSPAGRETPSHHRGARPDLPSRTEEPRVGQDPGQALHSARLEVPALRRRPEPPQEPAAARRGVRPDLRPGPVPRPRRGLQGRAFTRTCRRSRPRSRGVGYEDRVLLPGFVPDAELVHLYRRAYALVQPSLMEGFGLPPVEAMACGTPVVCSRAGSLPEVVGDAGLFFDPTDVGSIATTLRRLLAYPRLRDDLAGRALARASLFTWDRAAAALLECFSELDSPFGFRPTLVPPTHKSTVRTSVPLTALARRAITRSKR